MIDQFRRGRHRGVAWGVGGQKGGGMGERGGRIVAASEMLRPSVEHFQQAEVMPRGFKK